MGHVKKWCPSNLCLPHPLPEWNQAKSGWSWKWQVFIAWIPAWVCGAEPATRVENGGHRLSHRSSYYSKVPFWLNNTAWVMYVTICFFMQTRHFTAVFKNTILRGTWLAQLGKHKILKKNTILKAFNFSIFLNGKIYNIITFQKFCSSDGSSKLKVSLWRLAGSKSSIVHVSPAHLYMCMQRSSFKFCGFLGGFFCLFFSRKFNKLIFHFGWWFGSWKNITLKSKNLFPLLALKTLGQLIIVFDS